MSDKTNDEKLRILQERLAQIKQKNDTPVTTNYQRESDVEIETPNDESSRREGKSLNISWIKHSIIVGLVGCGVFYGYTNFMPLASNFSSEKINQDLVPAQLEYNLNLKGRNIAIISTKNSITEEGSAKAIVNDLKVKGFKCDYIYLPEKSNSNEEVYKVFIGPYENKEETNQWAKNLETKFNIITL